MDKTIYDVNICVRSNVLSQGELENAKNRVDQLRKQGHSSIAIMYFLARGNHTVRETLEGEDIVITIA